MAKQIATQLDVGIWVPENGIPFNAAVIFEQGQAGLGDLTLPGAGARTIIYGTDQNRNPVPIGSELATPGQPTLEIQNFLGFGRDLFQKLRVEGTCTYLQVRLHDCTSLAHPGGWTSVFHFGTVLQGDETVTAPASSTFASAQIAKTNPQQPLYDIYLVRPALTALTANITESEHINGITFIDEPRGCGSCGEGYEGPGRIGFATADAGGGATANVHYTTNGGGLFTAYGTDPFSTDEDAVSPVAASLNQTQWRLIVGRGTTDVANPAEIAYTDLTKGDEGTLSSWTAVNVGSTNGDIIQALFWPRIQRMYAGVSGDIYVSTDQGESWTLVYDGSNQINGFYEAANGYIYAITASGGLLLEKASSGTFEAITDPTGTDDNTAVAVANDGTIWLVNGQYLWRSKNKQPTATGQWVQVKDFGASHTGVENGLDVKGGAKAFGGDSKLVNVVITEAATDGDLWITIDGGGYIEEIPNLTNTGYLAAWFSKIDPNLGFIAGEDGVIHKISPTTGL